MINFSSEKVLRKRRIKKIGIILSFILLVLAVIMCIVISEQLVDGESAEAAAPAGDYIYSPSLRLQNLSAEYSGRLIPESCDDTYSSLGGIEPDFVLTSSHLMVYDETHKKILFQKNADEKAYPASTTKLLTACVAAQYCDKDTVFTVGDELSLVAWDSSVAYLQRGQKLSFEQLMDALLLPSGNDAAYVMAAGVGRLYREDENLPYEEAVSVFCSLMNNTANRIGALDSNFTCPDGYHNDDHYTTAADMMKIALYASSFESVRNSYTKSEATHTILSGESFTWYNSNPLIDSESQYYYSYATGMKTGFTDMAGSCLVASAEKDGTKIIAVALDGISVANRNTDLINLFNKAFDCVQKTS